MSQLNFPFLTGVAATESQFGTGLREIYTTHYKLEETEGKGV